MQYQANIMYSNVTRIAVLLINVTICTRVWCILGCNRSILKKNNAVELIGVSINTPKLAVFGYVCLSYDVQIPFILSGQSEAFEILPAQKNLKALLISHWQTPEGTSTLKEGRMNEKRLIASAHFNSDIQDVQLATKPNSMVVKLTHQQQQSNTKGMGQYEKAIPLLKVVQRESFQAWKFCVAWDPPLENHNTIPVLISSGCTL